LKQNIYNQCLRLLNQKIEELNSALNTATESANNETKSSAGDKHETSRAMMQIEQEKLGITKISNQIAKGTLIKTDKGFLFLSIGLGKMIVDTETVFVVSPLSPLGLKLIGLKENDNAEMNGVTYTIEKLF
jgi:hypothetical protein